MVDQNEVEAAFSHRFNKLRRGAADNCPVDRPILEFRS
jgi:hypothetical protein